VSNFKEFWDEKAETAPQRDLDALEQKMLKHAIEYASRESQFYHSRIKEAGISPAEVTDRHSLKMVPMTVKDELRISQERAPPFGDYLATSFSQINRVHRTSGTTGRPLFLALTRRDIETMNECGARAFWSAGLRPGMSIVHCMNYCLWTGGYSDHSNLEKTGAAVVPFGVGQSKLLVRTIQLLKVKAISATTSYLGLLENVVREELGVEPRELGLEWAFLGGEMGLSIPSFRKAIEEKWGLRAMDANYGLADVLSILASECSTRDGMHFHGQGKVLCELIEGESGEVIPLEEGAQGEFVLTNLEKEAQPLIRFRSGDIVRVLSTGGCECGRTGFKFKVIGRTQDVLKVKGINIYVSALQEIISAFVPSLSGEFQIVLESPPPISHLRVAVESGSLDSSSATKSMEELRRVAKERLGIEIDFELVARNALPRTEGKTARIVRRY
jgi:phenylacetate-CoA ligase